LLSSPGLTGRSSIPETSQSITALGEPRRSSNLSVITGSPGQAGR
jgi:hypothetical protein